MKLFTPQQRWPIWLLSACVPLGFVATSFLYYPLILQSGLLDPNADSIGIPLVQDMYLATGSAPFIAVLTWACLRSYHGEADLLSWKHSVTIRFWVSTVTAGVFIAALIYDSIAGLISTFWWCNMVWITHYLILKYWILVLRAAALSKTK
jgi:hypothetical protein